MRLSGLRSLLLSASVIPRPTGQESQTINHKKKAASIYAANAVPAHRYWSAAASAMVHSDRSCNDENDDYDDDDNHDRKE